MVLPLSDDNPLEGITHAYVTWALIALNVGVFILLQRGYAGEIDIASAFSYGTIPAVVSHAAVLPDEYALLPPQLTLVSYMFLHGGWMHLIGNMAFLWVFGDNVEDALGHARYFIFYVLCGIAGGIAHTLAAPGSEIPLVGASGAISGIVAAYLMLHPRVRLWVLLFMGIPLRIPAILPLGAWIGFQVWSMLTVTEDGNAWWAHLGGLAAGAVLIVFMRRPGVPLWVLTPNGDHP
ncbi:rhomboid family intramembrane serine protease [Ancylobacter terrae]|uniref:rhomboid family intramembrane serine protease n=1 Tax=Ancylobacter sp. sgz301288 TaxID=3342077 RepID=UPI003857FABE